MNFWSPTTISNASVTNLDIVSPSVHVSSTLTLFQNGNLSITGNLSEIYPASTLDVEGPGNFILNGNSSIDTIKAANGTTTVNGNVSGSSVDVRGLGVFNLNGTNTASLLSITDGGTVNTNDLSNGAVSFDNGTLNMTGSTTSNAAVSVGSGGGTIGVGDGLNLDLGGELSGAGLLTKTGAGSLTLTGTSAATPTISVSQGTLTGNTDNLTGDLSVASPGTVVFNQSVDGAYTKTLSGDGTVVKDGAGILTLGGGSGFNGLFNVQQGRLVGDSTTLGAGIQNDARVDFLQNIDGYYSGSISGSGALVKLGVGKLSLSGGNTYTGPTDIYGGTLEIFDDGALGDTWSTVHIDNATLKFSHAMGSIRRIDVGVNGATLETSWGSETMLGGAVSGAGTLTKTGNDALTLTGDNTYAGGTDVLEGTLALGSGTSAGTGTVALKNNATLALTNSFALGNNVDLSDAPTVDVGANSVTMSGVVSGSGDLTKAGSGTLALTGDNTYSGSTYVDDGTLALGQDTSAGTGDIYFMGTTLKTLNSLTLSQNLNLFGRTCSVDTAGNDVTLAGTVDGKGGLMKIGNGTLSLTGSNSYGGETYVMGGTLAISSDDNLGGGALNLASGTTLRTDASMLLSHDVNLSGADTVDTHGNDVEIAGVIDGTGALVKTGDGALTLDGTNVYYGGTTVNGGTLALTAGDNLGSGALTLAGGNLRMEDVIGLTNDLALSSAATVDANGHDAALIGTISGAGPLTITGAGSNLFYLVGANTYAGGTTMDGGTLILNQDDNLGAASGGLTLKNAMLTTEGSFASARNVTLSNGGGVDTDGNNLTLSGTVSGDGGLAKYGAGTLTLAGHNTYRGGTAVQIAGTLSISSDDNLGDASGGLFLDGGSLSLGGGFTTSRNILSSTGTIDTNGHDLTVLGTFSGNGGLVKNGAGNLILAQGALTGGAAVNAGALAVARDGMVSGNLSIANGAAFSSNGTNQTVGAVMNRGTIVTGAGKLTADSYAGGGTLAVTLRPEGANLTVLGAANVSSGTLVLTGVPASGTYDVVNAGTLTGTLAGIAAATGKSVSARYTGTDLFLDVTTISTLSQTDPGSSSSGLAGLFDQAAAHSSGDLDDVILRLNALTPAGQSAALHQITPLTFASLSGLSFTGSSGRTSALGQRMAGLRSGGATGGRAAAFSSRTDHRNFMVADAPGDVTPRYFPETVSPLGVFASVMGGRGRQKERTGASGTEPGYSFTSGGVVGGADYRLGETSAVGLYVAASHAGSDVDQDGGTLENDGVGYGVYATAARGPVHGNLTLGGANDRFDSRRNITSFGRTASASPKGRELNASLRGGYDVLKDVSILGGLSSDRLSVESFSESGAGALDLRVARQTDRSVRSNLGAKVSRSIEWKGVAWTPSVSMEWLRELGHRNRGIDAELASVGAFRTETAKVARDGALTEVGLSAAWNKAFSAGLSYTGEFRQGFNDQGLRADARWAF